MAGNWVIQELKPDGSGGYTPNEDGERFIWNASDVPPDDSTGGAKSAPLKPWPTPIVANTVRTEYPGSRRVSEQVMGGFFAPFTLRGKWLDKWNFPDFAWVTYRRFEAMALRVPVVRISWQDQQFDGIIKEFTPEIEKRSHIRWSFTFSNHGRPDATLSDRAPITIPSAVQSFDETVLLARPVRGTMTEAPFSTRIGDAFAAAVSAVDKLDASMEHLANNMDQSIRPVTRPIGEFRRMASSLRRVQGNCTEILAGLVAVRSDVEAANRSARQVLDFEAWARDMKFYVRLLQGKSREQEKAMRERDEPDAIALYEPYAGESLYSVSRRFYGTPHAWRGIMDRNDLHSLTLDGTEALIIPERS